VEAQSIDGQNQEKALQPLPIIHASIHHLKAERIVDPLRFQIVDPRV
jgi:hypothetical protein